MNDLARHDADHLAALLRKEHHAMADFLVALAAFDERRRWADLGHANLWAFLHRELGLSAGAAHWRKVACRLVRAFPSVERALRDGRLCLSSVVELAKVLTPANEAVVIPRYLGLSAREAREVTVELAPRPAIPAREVITAALGGGPEESIFRTSESALACVRQGEPAAGGLPAPGSEIEPPRGDSPDEEGLLPGTVPVLPSGCVTARPSADVPPPESRSSAICAIAGREVFASSPLPPTSSGARPLPSAGTGRIATPSRQEEVVPFSPDLRRLHLTVSRTFLAKLESAKALRAHAQPGASAAAILERALDLLLDQEAARRKAATTRPGRHQRPCAPDRVPASVRREVWTRDEGRCQWPLEGGAICGSAFRLELDHVQPKARGGPSTPENLRLLCGPHNAEAARRTYGAAFMSRVVAEARAERRTKGRTKGPKRGRSARRPRSGKDEGPPACAEGPSDAPQA